MGGLPTPDVSWYLDGKAIRPDDYHKMLVCEKGMHSFIIEIVTVHHAGVYECVARNRAGESRFTMRLNVIGKYYHTVLFVMATDLTIPPFTVGEDLITCILVRLCSSGSAPSSYLCPEDGELQSSRGRHDQVRVQSGCFPSTAAFLEEG